MNFLIVDNEFHSVNFIEKLTSEFYHVKFLTSNPTVSTKLSPSSFISIAQTDLNNASEMIRHLSKHENDPFNAILLFNCSSPTSLRNILNSMERYKRQPPHLFLIQIHQKLDEKSHTLLHDSPDTLPWTILFCNGINSSSTSSNEYHIKQDFNSTDGQSISVNSFLQFLLDELQTKKYLHQTIFSFSH